jgi:adenylyltransferase and sulfurtransferase
MNSQLLKVCNQPSCTGSSLIFCPGQKIDLSRKGFYLFMISQRDAIMTFKHEVLTSCFGCSKRTRIRLNHWKTPNVVALFFAYIENDKEELSHQNKTNECTLVYHHSRRKIISLSIHHSQLISQSITPSKVRKKDRTMDDCSQVTLFLSEHSTESSDHVILSSSAIADARRQHCEDFDRSNSNRMLHPRPTVVMREWLDDMKRRLLQVAAVNTTTSTQVNHEEDYCLVLNETDSLLSENNIIRLDDDSHDVEGLEMSMMVDIHSDPLIELMLENRISRLESDLQACELEYEKQIRSLEYELQQKALEHSKDNFVYQSRIQELELQNLSLQQENEALRMATNQEKAKVVRRITDKSQDSSLPSDRESVKQLSMDQILRYSRQLLLSDGFGVNGQCKLLSSSVLVVGAGGIGSTALMYLASSGVGHISVVDFDVVDKSNLHRQVIHNEEKDGMNKAISACQFMKALNPTIQCTPIVDTLTFENALELVTRHDCVLDASDNPQTRYLINDACVLAKKPLISGSALGTEGQLTVYNHKEGPCYRCLYPKPTATKGCKSCSDHGVLGPVPGLVGILQALETLKVLTGVGDTMHDRLLMYDALPSTFRSLKKPSKLPSCAVCGPSPSIRSMADSKAMTSSTRGPAGQVQDGKLISPYIIPPPIPNELSISCKEYEQFRMTGLPHILLDVRVKKQYEMCSLESSINIPLSELPDQLDRLEQLSGGIRPIFCICRRGIFSVEATHLLSKAKTEGRSGIHSVKNITGGLAFWSDEVDSSFPKY